MSNMLRSILRGIIKDALQNVKLHCPKCKGKINPLNMTCRKCGTVWMAQKQKTEKVDEGKK